MGALPSAFGFDIAQSVRGSDMTDTLSKAARSARMSLVRGKDTKPELWDRRLVHRIGYRYRLHRPSLPGKPDLVFGPRWQLIFVHGCFWHRHDDPACRLARVPKLRIDFWLPKLEGNKARDERTVIELRKLGWDTLVIWECQTRNEDVMMRTISQFLDDAQ